MHDQGVKIHLHCFEYGRGEQPFLNQYCQKVYYYKRKKTFSLRIPYIVISRKNPKLLQNLQKDNFPVLLEGIHCTFYLYNTDLKNREIWVRLHNVEFEYYQQLAHSTSKFLKKVYYLFEAKLLKKYERKLAQTSQYLAVNEKDKGVYETEFTPGKIKFLPVFLPFHEVNILPGRGNYYLYHGNLSVAENEKAALWILNEIANFLPDFQFIVAGKNPSGELKKQIAVYSNAELISNPSQEKMEALIKNAHAHLMPSFNATGIKIKLLNALFNGRFILTNKAAIEGTKFASLCLVAETAGEMIQKIREISIRDFDKQLIELRKILLESEYNNEKNARRLMNWIYKE